jgi:hypothetical protein
MLFAMAVGDDMRRCVGPTSLETRAHVFSVHTPRAPRLTTFGPMTDQFDRQNASNDAPPKKYYNRSLLSSNVGQDIVQHMCGTASIPFTFEMSQPQRVTKRIPSTQPEIPSNTLKLSWFGWSWP